jgi:putative ABC transport system substrate-binding protein
MRRRELNILLLAGAAAVYPLVARAQSPDRIRRIGVLMLYPENDPQGQLRAIAFQRELEKDGWTIGKNLQINYQWGTGDADWVRSAIAQMLRQAPDVLLANGDAAIKAAQQSTQTVPVIFIGGGDPVGDGLVQSLAHPGGNLTGFTVMEPSLGAKLLGMLKQVAPSVARVATLLNPDNATHRRIFALLVAAAPAFAVEVSAAPVHEAAEIEAAMTQWGQGVGNGVIVPSDPSTNSHRRLIIDLASRYRLPTVYALRSAAEDGGLMSYGVDLIELYLTSEELERLGLGFAPEIALARRSLRRADRSLSQRGGRSSTFCRAPISPRGVIKRRRFPFDQEKRRPAIRSGRGEECR